MPEAKVPIGRRQFAKALAAPLLLSAVTGSEAAEGPSSKADARAVPPPASPAPHNSLDVRSFGAAGDGKADDTAAIQAAIDHALRSNIQSVVIPEGAYRTTDTLHLGYGDTFRQISLIGTPRAAFGGEKAGATILPDRTDRPCINIQGGRNVLISGLAIIGKLRPHISDLLAKRNHFSAEPRDYLAPALTPSGLDPFRPYAGITVDAYSGARPAAAYPDVAYPAWTGIKGQYQRVFSSGVQIEQCDIQGFAVGFANQPCDADGNGDFTKIRNCQFGYCVYAVAICNGQSRNVEIGNSEYVGCHTFLTTGHFGRKSGQLGGPLHNISGGLGYQFMDVPAPGYTATIRVSNLYFEAQVRIGFYGGGAAWPAPLVFDSCLFSFGSVSPNKGGHGVTARAALESHSGSPISFRQCAFAHFETFAIPVHFAGAPINSSTPGVVFENCTFIPGYSQTPAEITPAVAQAVNWFGGVFAQGLLNRSIRIIGANTGTYWPTGRLDKPPTSQRISESLLPPINGDRLVLNPAARELTDVWGQPWRIRSAPRIGNIHPSWWVVAPVQRGRTLKGGISSRWIEGTETWSGYRLEAGDILWESAGGQLFVVTTVEKSAVASLHDVTATLMNGFTLRVDGNVDVERTLPTPAALTLIKTGTRLSANVYFGDFTAGSATVANVHRGDGYAGDLAAHVWVGDPLPDSPAGDAAIACPTASRTKVATVTNGSPGTVTLTRPAKLTGRFAILPVLIG